MSNQEYSEPTDDLEPEEEDFIFADDEELFAAQPAHDSIPTEPSPSGPAAGAHTAVHNGHRPQRKPKLPSPLPRRVAPQPSATLSAEYELMTALAETAADSQNRTEAMHLAAAIPPLATQLVSRYRRAI